MAKATEEQFDELHNLVTTEFLTRVRIALDGSPLSKLAAIMPTVDPELVQRRLYGSKSR